MSIGPLPSIRDIAATQLATSQSVQAERTLQAAAAHARRIASDQKSADAATRVEDLNDNISLGDDSGGDGRLPWQPHGQGNPQTAEADEKGPSPDSTDDPPGQHVDLTA